MRNTCGRRKKKNFAAVSYESVEADPDDERREGQAGDDRQRRRDEPPARDAPGQREKSRVRHLVNSSRRASGPEIRIVPIDLLRSHEQDPEGNGVDFEFPEEDLAPVQDDRRRPGVLLQEDLEIVAQGRARRRRRRRASAPCRRDSATRRARRSRRGTRSRRRRGAPGPSRAGPPRRGSSRCGPRPACPAAPVRPAAMSAAAVKSGKPGLIGRPRRSSARLRRRWRTRGRPSTRKRWTAQASSTAARSRPCPSMTESVRPGPRSLPRHGLGRRKIEEAPVRRPRPSRTRRAAASPVPEGRSTVLKA